MTHPIAPPPTPHPTPTLHFNLVNAYAFTTHYSHRLSFQLPTFISSLQVGRRLVSDKNIFRHFNKDTLNDGNTNERC